MSRPLNKMANRWLTHVKHTMKAHKGKKFSEVLKLAKKTYKGGGGGGVQPFNSFGAGSDLSFSGTGAASPTDPLAGSSLKGGRRRTRRGRKSRKGGNMY